jgi:hypothetical protein
MRSFRTNRRSGSWLGLTALALQLVLSFGHVHLEGIRSGTPALLTPERLATQPSPAQHPTHDADDYCAICATIHLASTSFLPDPPQLPVPFVSQTVEHFHHLAFIFIAPQRTAFQSRAPPLV